MTIDTDTDTGPTTTTPDDEKAVVSLVSDDTTSASASSSGAAPDDFEEDNDDNDDDNDDENPMPLLTYSRLAPTCTSTPTRKNTCSVMAQVWLDPTTTEDSTEPTMTSPTTNTSTTTSTTMEEEEHHEDNPQWLLKSDLWKKQPHWILAVGMSNGNVSLISVDGSSEVLASQSLSAREGGGGATAEASSSFPVIDVSLDASGTVLAAVDAGGTCAIWELQYGVKYPTTTIEQPPPLRPDEQPTLSSTTAVAAPSQAAEGNMFSSFMSALTGMPPPPPPPSSSSEPTTTTHSNHPTTPTTTTGPSQTTTTTATTKITPRLTATILQVSRITYPPNWDAPSCMALDPAHKRKREKSLLVGFADGRLLLTKRGGLFQRRNDTVLYQGTPDGGGGGGNGESNTNSSRGIQAVAWRGNLVAWADATGMKLLDVETLTRIAHIDRPTGARPSLYPAVAGFQPHLYFEQSNKLLVAWGDCLMGMQIQTVKVDAASAATAGATTTTTITTTTDVKRRKTVECTMAWELDCVACGVIPLDPEHVVVFGLVPPEDDDDNDDNDKNGDDGHDLEVQIVRRRDGTVRYCDSLPLNKSGGTNESYYTLLSSFALPRMDDAYELEELLKKGGGMGQQQQSELVDLNALFATGESSSLSSSRYKAPTFRESHLDWNVESILFEEEEEEEDTNSVDSDDYEFVLRPIIDASIDLEDMTPPPLLVVASASDLVLARMSNVDDAVAHALSQNKCALALSRGLRHRRQLRRYELSDLVHHYLEAVLQLSPSGAGAEAEDTMEEESTLSLPLPLSLRRMQLAVQAMPVLLGGRIELWERWAGELERIPGSLFLLRNHLPVRDPILPSNLYERVLETMLLEIEQLSAAKNNDEAKETTSAAVTVRFDHEAASHFLESLVAWGPTKTLKEYIKLYKYSRERRRRKGGDKSSSIANKNNNELKTVEIALQRRYLQTAAGYLHFPVTTQMEKALQAAAPRYEAHKDDSQDSLYRIDKMIQLVSPRAPLVALPEEDFKDTTESSYSLLAPNNRICLEAMAGLRMMQNRYDLTLKCFLSIGACHSPQSMDELEASAVDIVNGVSDPKTVSRQILIGSSSYEFVLGIIEFNHLHQLLLDKNFILSTDSKLFMPLFALLRLIGLPLMGQFLMDHCVSPEFSSSETTWSERGSNDESKDPVRRETLPIDRVAEQLEHSPALLHWYLHLVFTKKSELYVKFPNNSVPPKSITDLHRKHFKLYVDFAGDDKDSAKSLSGTETYKVDAKTTPLLSFLKAALPLGGVLPVDARRLLEIQRSQGTDDSDDEEAKKESTMDSSHSFSLELAYIIEHYSEQTEAEAMGILDLYLQGANSLMLAVSYAQRQRRYSSMLWDKLISYCLSNNSKGFGGIGQDGQDGILFGALLEAAALSGADLARLVARIPPGMVVEGLRPRLVAAVADYRLKLDIHQAAAAACFGRTNISPSGRNSQI